MCLGKAELVGQVAPNTISSHFRNKCIVYFVDKQHKIIPVLGGAYGVERKKERFAPNLHELMAGWLLQCEGQYLLKHFPVEYMADGMSKLLFTYIF